MITDFDKNELTNTEHKTSLRILFNKKTTGRYIRELYSLANFDCNLTRYISLKGYDIERTNTKHLTKLTNNRFLSNSQKFFILKLTNNTLIFNDRKAKFDRNTTSYCSGCFINSRTLIQENIIHAIVECNQFDLQRNFVKNLFNLTEFGEREFRQIDCLGGYATENKTLSFFINLIIIYFVQYIHRYRADVRSYNNIEHIKVFLKNELTFLQTRNNIKFNRIFRYLSNDPQYEGLIDSIRNVSFF